MSESPNIAVPPPLPASSSVPSAEKSAKRGWLSIPASILAIGVAVFAIYSAVSPFFCSDCFYIKTLSMNDAFAKFGYDREFVLDMIVAADKAIEAGDYPRRIFYFDSSGHVGSINGQHLKNEVGNIVFGDPKTVRHGTLEQLRLIEYKIPGLDIGLAALMDIVETVAGTKLRKVSIQLSCTGTCEAQTWHARIGFDEDKHVVEVSGADMLRYVNQVSYPMFLRRLDVTAANVNPVDFLSFVTFEAKQYTDPCTRYMLLLGYAPEVVLTNGLRMQDMFGPYALSECTFLISAINLLNAAKYDYVVSEQSTATLLDRDTDGLQYWMVSEFARFKLGDKESVDLATSVAHWIDDGICKPGVPDTNREGSLHRYILGKWGTRCPLSEAYPAR
jgi:hypothetical protein